MLPQAPITPLTWLISIPSSSCLQNEDGDPAYEQYMAIPACQLLPAPHEGGVTGGDRPEQMLEAQTSWARCWHAPRNMLAGSPGARSQPCAITSVPEPSPGAFLGQNSPEVKGMWGRAGRKHRVEGSREGGGAQGSLLGMWGCGEGGKAEDEIREDKDSKQTGRDRQGQAEVRGHHTP